MGCCTQANDQGFKGNATPKDLAPMTPGVKNMIKDPLTHFEKNFPFYMCHITLFQNLVIQSGKSQLDYDLLQQTFDTPAWKDQFKKGTALFNLISKLPDSNEQYVDAEAFICLGYLWCAGAK